MVGVTQVEPGLGQEAIEEAGPVSPCSSAIASRMGAIILHGPYHLARWSTRTAFVDYKTSALKVLSVTGLVAPPPQPDGW